MLPTDGEVMESATNDAFRLENWKKHRDHDRYELRPYPFWGAYEALDGQQFTRQDVFSHFDDDPMKGVISAIKWGYPTGGRPRGSWKAFSDAFRKREFVTAIAELRAEPAPQASALLARLNDVVSGVGSATTTKIAYFAGLKTQEGDCLIYDSMVRRAIAHRSDEDFADLKAKLMSSRGDITPKAQMGTYGLYLKSVEAAAKRYEAKAAHQVELFLFRAGRELPPRR